MRKKMRSSVAVAAAFGVAMAGLTAAGPAVAQPWGGSITCPSSVYVKASGFKGLSGPITVSAGGHSFTDSYTTTGYSVTVRGRSYSGSWMVAGSGATSGYGFCGV